MSKLYAKTPSEVMNIEDEYIAYCFNEACAYIIGRLQNGDELQFKKKYTSFSDLYRNYV